MLLNNIMEPRDKQLYNQTKKIIYRAVKGGKKSPPQNTRYNRSHHKRHQKETP